MEGEHLCCVSRLCGLFFLCSFCVLLFCPLRPLDFNLLNSGAGKSEKTITTATSQATTLPHHLSTQSLVHQHVKHRNQPCLCVAWWCVTGSLASIHQCTGLLHDLIAWTKNTIHDSNRQHALHPRHHVYGGLVCSSSLTNQTDCCVGSVSDGGVVGRAVPKLLFVAQPHVGCKRHVAGPSLHH